jgi:ribonucleoside-diphosphate reductase alpha chain
MSNRFTATKFVPSDNSLTLYKKRYVPKNETVEDVWKVVSDGNQEFYDLMEAGLFLPNSPTIFNHNRKTGCTSSACFVFNVADEMGPLPTDSHRSIVNTAAKAIAVAKAGGGVGYYGGELRPRNSVIKSVHRKACGPAGVLKFYHRISDLITQGGKRELAQMWVQPIEHPDAEEIIHIKDADPQGLGSFNISMSWTDASFAEIDDKNSKYHSLFWDHQVHSAWSHGCPGVMFPDVMNKPRWNPNPHLGLILATNPSLRAGTRVLTDGGIFPIEKLEGKDFNVPNLNRKLSDARCFLSGRQKPLYRIRLKGGREVYATAEHKWPVEYKGHTFKVSTDKLHSGQRLPIGGLDVMPFGDRFTGEDGFFVGWVIADGSVCVRSDTGTKQINLIMSEEKMKCGPGKRIIRYLESKGCKAQFSARERDGSTWWELNTQNAALQEVLDQSGFSRKEDGLPSSVWDSASEEFRKGLIDALISADGCVRNTGGYTRLYFTTSRERLAKDVHELLGFYGLHVSMSQSETDSVEFPNGKVYGRSYSRYDLSISRASHLRRFASLFPLTHSMKQGTIENIVTSKKVRWDDHCVEVVSVEMTDLREDVWDISVYDDTHCFALSGCVTGNCGETGNRSDEPCNLGSLCLWRFIDLKTRKFNWGMLEDAVRAATRFLDWILDTNTFPHPEITKAALLTRKLGLGVMGWADSLAMMGVHYDTHVAVQLGKELMRFISNVAVDESVRLAKVKGPYLGFDQLTLAEMRRNETNTSIAPTGSIAILADCFGSIEPFYALEWDRVTAEGMKMKEVPHTKQYWDGHVPKTAGEIGWEWHVKHQAAFQAHTDLGVSKTINLPNSATKEDVANAYRLMHKLECKGGTIFRDGCRSEQVLRATKTKSVYGNGEEKSASSKINEELIDSIRSAKASVTTPTVNVKPQQQQPTTSPPEKKGKRPDTLPGFIHRVTMGDSKFFIQVSLHDGKLYEVFITAKRAGSTVSGLLSTWAISFSKGLQSGVSLEKLCQAHVGSRFEPNGMTTNKEIPVCTSIPDYVCKWLLMKFGQKAGNLKDVVNGTDSGCFCPDCDSPVRYVGGCLTCDCGWSKCG